MFSQIAEFWRKLTRRPKLGEATNYPIAPLSNESSSPLFENAVPPTTFTKPSDWADEKVELGGYEPAPSRPKTEQ